MINKSQALVLSLFLFGIGLNGQDREFTAAAPSVVNVGEQFQYVIEGSERGDVLLPNMGEFQLLAGPFSSYSSHSQWVNGKMTMNTVVTYTHVFRAAKAGSYTIPPATVRVGRKEYKTNAVEIVVNGNGSQPSPSGTGQPEGGDGANALDEAGDNQVFLRVIPSKSDVYVGEQLVSGLQVYTRVNTRPASAGKDIPYEGFYKKSLDPDATAQQQEVDGQQYITQVIQRHILIPQKSGNVVIAPYESEWIIQQRVQRRNNNSIFDDFFDDPFFSNMQDVPVKLATKPVTIRVKPLPPGAPGGFTGAVGDFSMDASISDNEIAVNEALSLKITIRGAGNIPLLGQPEVSLPPDHDLYDVNKSLNISTSGNRITGSVTFEYPIVARHAGRFRIAPVQFSWFDPAGGKYHSITTQEFNFTVLKGEAGDESGGVYVPGIMQESVANIGTDIRDISREPQVFTPLASSLMANSWYRRIYGVAVLLAIAVGVLIRIVARRNADLTLVRNRQANRSARDRLKKADRFRKAGNQERFYEEVGKAIWGYLSDKLNIETSDLSREVILKQMQNLGVSDEVRSEFLRILDESEFSRFAPSSDKRNLDQLFDDAVAIIRNLESSLK